MSITPGDQRHVVGERAPLEAPHLVGVAGVGHRDDERADVGLVEQRLDLVEGDVVGVRPLVVAPAHVQAHGGRVDALERAVDGVDHQLHPAEELRQRPVGEQRVALEGEVGRVDLQQQAAVDDRLVLGAQGGGDGPHVLLLRGVVPVLHRGGDDAGRARGHERLGERRVGHEGALRVELGSCRGR